MRPPPHPHPTSNTHTHKKHLYEIVLDKNQKKYLNIQLSL